MNDGRLIGQQVFQFLRSEQVNAISEHAEVVEYSAGDTIYYTPGNNDITTDAMAAQYYRYAGEPFHVKDLSGVRIVVVDTRDYVPFQKQMATLA